VRQFYALSVERLLSSVENVRAFLDDARANLARVKRDRSLDKKYLDRVEVELAEAQDKLDAAYAHIQAWRKLFPGQTEGRNDDSAMTP